MPIDDERAAWLAGLQVGDEVAVCRSLWTPAICKVLRTTATQIILNYGIFRRDDGIEKRAADRWTARAVLHPVTQEKLDAIERERNIGQLNRTGWGKLTDDQLRRIRAIVDEGATNDNEN